MCTFCQLSNLEGTRDKQTLLQTVCECHKFGTFAVIAEMVEDPYVPPEQQWLTIVKYCGLVVSLACLLFFTGIIAVSK